MKTLEKLIAFFKRLLAMFSKNVSEANVNITSDIKLKIESLQDFAKYKNYDIDEHAILKNVPMEYRDKVLELGEGAIRLRYRGPRRPHSFQGRHTCLKKDARTFSVYYKG